MDEVSRSPRRRRPWFITFCGLAAMAGLVAMPFLAGEPDGDRVPDWVRFAGRFHPALLHLPIGVFVLILLQETGAMFSRRAKGSSLFPVFFGAASAVLAVLAGFLLYHGGGYEGNELAERHLWGGLVFAVAAVFTFVVKAWTVALEAGAAFFRLLLFGSAGVMGFASHDGASLTHGKNYLTQYAPDAVRRLLGLETKPAPAPAPAGEANDPVVYRDLIAPMFERTCVQCHKEGKAKGRLRMDTYELLLKGGKEGPAIEPGSAKDSNLLYRIELPVDDDEHMPPEGKPDLEEHELVVLKWWIDSGADPEKRVGDFEASSEVREAIQKFAPTAPKEAAVPDAALEANVEELSKTFPGALSYESRQSDGLVFNAVTIRESFDDETLAKLEAVMPRLVSLDLASTKVTDRGVEKLAGAENLRTIRLSETGIGNPALATLAKLRNLESINVYGTGVTDEGVLALAGLPKLKRLYLWRTEVSPEAIARLAEKLPGCEIVTGG